MAYKMKGFSGFKSSPAKHGTTDDFLYGKNGHNPDIMEGKHEDWHTDKIEAEKKKPSPNKQRRVKRKTTEDVAKKQREKDLAKWKENKNADLRFFEKNTDESGKINPDANYLGEWKKRKMKQHLKEIAEDAIKKSKDKSKPIA